MPQPRSRRHGLLLVVALLNILALAHHPPIRAGAATAGDDPLPALPVVQRAVSSGCAPTVDGWQLVNQFGGDAAAEGELAFNDGYASDSCHLVLVGQRLRTYLDKDGRTRGNFFGVVAHSDDGGVTLRLSELPEFFEIEYVAFSDARHGWATGQPGAGQLPNQTSGLVHTEDGGETWTDVPLPPEIRYPQRVRVSAGRLWLASGPQLWASEDEAVTWRLAVEVTNRAPVPESVRITGKYRGPLIYDVAVAGDLVLVAAVDYQSGVALVSRDGGQSFSETPDTDGEATFTEPRNAAIASPTTLLLDGYRVGRRSLDGGATWLPWTPVGRQTSWGGGALYFLSPTEGYAAIGYQVPPADPSDRSLCSSVGWGMAHTTDAGASWTVEPIVCLPKPQPGFSSLFASGDGVLFYVDTAGLYVRRF